MLIFHKSSVCAAQNVNYQVSGRKEKGVNDLSQGYGNFIAKEENEIPERHLRFVPSQFHSADNLTYTPINSTNSLSTYPSCYEDKRVRNAQLILNKLRLWYVNRQ